MAEYNSDRTGANIDATLDKVDALVDSANNVTASSVDVTGTVTADGLTVDAAQKIIYNANGSQTNSRKYQLRNDDSAYGDFGIKASSSNSTEPTKNRLNINKDGDVSFYEDTGTTAKMVWDASAESLGIGTSTVDEIFHVNKDSSGRAIVGKFENGTNAADTRATISLANHTDVCTTYLTSHRTGANFGADFAIETSDGSTGSIVERMRITESGNVGVGTSSPDSPLSVMAETLSDVPSAGSPSGHFAVGKNDQYGTMVGTLGSGKGYVQQQRFDGNATTYDLLLQPNGGNLGIGTDSPSSALHISNSTPTITLTDSDASGINSTIGGSSGRLTFDADADNYGTGEIYFKQAGSERARIDSSGNLLVGKTSTNTDAVGFEARATGLNAMVRDGGEALVLGRKTSDGSILSFRKDGSTVGSIGAKSSDLTIGTNDTGFKFVDGFNMIQPVNVSTGADRDGAISLGYTGQRFKDLYLSGGVYLGGTGSANKLDDYEEGTWTPGDNNITYTSPIGRYEKIGRVVHVRGFFEVPTNTNGNAADISLPFTYNEAGTHYITCHVATTDGSNSDIQGRFSSGGAGSQYIHIVDSSESTVTCATLSGKQIRFRATYTTNS